MAKIAWRRETMAGLAGAIGSVPDGMARAPSRVEPRSNPMAGLYASFAGLGLAHSGGTLIVCGLQPPTIAQMRSAGLPESVALLAQSDELEGSLTQAYEHATKWLAAAGEQAPPEPQP
jgi:hypothetical protein